MFFRQIFDPKLAQYAYLIGCQQTGEAVVIDPERDVDRYRRLAAEEGLRIVAATETHIHADFLSGVRELAAGGARAYLSGEGGVDWSYGWAEDPRDDVVLLHDGDVFTVGKIEIKAVHTPGHTPEHLSFMVKDVGGGADQPMGIVTGDFVFVADLGRPDLLESAAGEVGAMEPSARALYRSVGQFLKLPDYLQIWPGHGAGSACGKALGAVPESTVGYERRFNASIAAAARGEDAFVEAILDGQPEPPQYFARMKRDNKAGPVLLGDLPSPEALDERALASLADRTDIVVVDTRADRRAFMAGHVGASLYAPMNRSFNTVVGCYVEPGVPIYLIIEDERVEEAVRDLVRIGLDEIVGYATPAVLGGLCARGASASIPVGDFASTLDRLGAPDTQVLDVRRRVEYEAGHLPGAANIAHTRLLGRAGEVTKGTTHVVHCLSGARAAVASAFLARLGHEVVYVDDHVGNVPSERLEKGPASAG